MRPKSWDASTNFQWWLKGLIQSEWWGCSHAQMMLLWSDSQVYWSWYWIYGDQRGSHAVYKWHSSLGILKGLIQDICEEQVECNSGKHTSQFHPTRDVRGHWSVTNGDDVTYHAIVKKSNILYKFDVDLSYCWLNLEVSWYSLEQYIWLYCRQAFNYCCSLLQVWKDPEM